jgi:histidinol-phosphate/aromatic aminotransferase/cobyric acid decarboxylase-like protein
MAAKIARQKILVRWFNFPEVKNYLRITIGTPAEADGPGRTARRILPR